MDPSFDGLYRIHNLHFAIWAVSGILAASSGEEPFLVVTEDMQSRYALRILMLIFRSNRLAKRLQALARRNLNVLGRKVSPLEDQFNTNRIPGKVLFPARLPQSNRVKHSAFPTI